MKRLNLYGLHDDMRFRPFPRISWPCAKASSLRYHRAVSSSITLPLQRVRGLGQAAISAGDQTPSLERSETLDSQNASSRYPNLPWTCPGCGAYSQAQKPGEAGFYSVTRNRVSTYVSSHDHPSTTPAGTEQEIIDKALGKADHSLLESLGIASPHETGKQNAVFLHILQSPTLCTDDSAHFAIFLDIQKPNMPSIPLCDRCHTLIHESKGHSIKHPSLQAIADILSQSPYKLNHIYHVIDAADFPLSVIPRIHHVLSLSPQRSANRRSKAVTYVQGQKFDLSFVITRSDLLAPRKELVDTLMPTLVAILRNVLHGHGARFRLGNIYCVSSQRGWWTKKLKEDIWNRGEGGWMIGKVNVGKSGLVGAVYPKRRGLQDKAEPNILQQPRFEAQTSQACRESDSLRPTHRNEKNISIPPGTQDLLPPSQPHDPYPMMPIVSHIPGTTASPVRLLFGSDGDKGKGELIDLPGLARETMDDFVLEQYRASLVMRRHVNPKQYTVKPGQSLIVSNLIRITPAFDDMILLACPFLTIDCHVTQTRKAEAILAQQHFTAVKGIAKPGVEASIASAGTFKLRWNATKLRTGPLTTPDAAKLDPRALPFVIYSMDLLIEGSGWIELAVQVRKRLIEVQGPGCDPYPAVEVFSPLGKFIGTRPPLNLWIRTGQGRKAVNKKSKRPLRSKKGDKKRLKKELRWSKEITSMYD